MLLDVDAREAPSTYVKLISPTYVSGLLRIADLISIGAVGVGIYLFYVYSHFGEFSSRYAAAIIAGTFLAGMIFQWFSIYKHEHIFSRRFPIDRLLSAWAIAFSILLAIAFTLKVSSFYSRVWAVSWFVGSAVVLTTTRIAIGQWIRERADEGCFAERTVILGAGEQGQRLAAYLREQNDPRMRIVGFIDDRKTRVPHNVHGYQVLGDIDHLIELIRGNLVDQIFVALPWHAHERLNHLIHELAITPVRICLTPDLLGLDFPNKTFTSVAKVPMLQLFERPISGWSHVTKAVEDRIIAGLALLFIGPLMALIALAIKLDSPGPVFFKQPRYGFNNLLINVWKFRTMYNDQSDRNCEAQTVKNDPRVTRVGDFLRKSSLDELPQLINVLIGNMSLVGPRPHAVSTKAEGALFTDVVDRYAARHRVKPGITGWAQVNGWRGETDTIEKIQKRVEHDIFYIDNWSIWFDLKILFRTVAVVFKSENAY
ncbi:MAG: undecaprenyl-phosphate glucose phosphotransferase [Pseudomonadota bacterium]